MPEVNDFMREEASAPVYNQAVTHSARFFLLLCLIVGAGFGTMTFAIPMRPQEPRIYSAGCRSWGIALPRQRRPRGRSRCATLPLATRGRGTDRSR